MFSGVKIPHFYSLSAFSKPYNMLKAGGLLSKIFFTTNFIYWFEACKKSYVQQVFVTVPTASLQTPNFSSLFRLAVASSIDKSFVFKPAGRPDA